MSDRDLEEMADDLDGKAGQSGGVDDLSHFVDLEDLGDLVGDEDFADLEGWGDLSDLGDLSDMSDLSDLMDVPELDDIPDPETLSDEKEERGRAVTAAVQTNPPDADVLPEGLEDLKVDGLPDIALDDLPGEDLDVQSLLDSALDDLGEDSGLDAALNGTDQDQMMDEMDLDSMPDIALDDLEPESPPDVLSDDMGADSLPDVMLDDMGADGQPDGMDVDGLLDDMDLRDILGMDASLGEKEDAEGELSFRTVEPTPDAMEEDGEIPDIMQVLQGSEDDTGDIDGFEDLRDMFGDPDGADGAAPGEGPGLDGPSSADDTASPPGKEKPAIFNELSKKGKEGQATGDKEKKPGILKKLFGNIVTDEIAEAERAARVAEEEAAKAKVEAQKQAKKEKEAAKAAKAEEDAKKKEAKAEKKAKQKAAKAEKKARKKEEKKARKAEEAAQAEQEVTGKLNKVGVSIIVILTVMFLATEISGTQIFGYVSTLKDAADYFDMQKYSLAYQKILGTDVKEKDQETYDKIMTVMKVQRALNSYKNYDKMKYYPDALNALLVGLRKYDENIETAMSLGVDNDMDACRAEIISILRDEFGLSEQEAYRILSKGKKAYTDKVVQIGLRKR